MMPFEFISPLDLTEAAENGTAAGRKFVAGGTTLIDLMKLHVERPSHLIDLTPLVRRDASLGTVSDLPGGGLRLGALAHMSDVAWDARVKERYPLVSQSLLLAASGQVRNMATIAGNVLQRTRCLYFRDTAMPCNKREPGSGCSAIQGFNRQHAVLGGSEHCIAVHPSDFAVALAALDATVNVHSASGTRTMSFADLHTLPRTHPERETTLRAGEIITSIDLPALSFARRSVYLKVRDRASFAFALASAAVAVNLNGGRIRDARVAIGGVATIPWRSREAERSLLGERANAGTFRAAANAALAGARSYKHNAFKIELARRTLVRALTEASS